MLCKGIIFSKDGMICLKESGRKLETNFGNGGMKALMVYAIEAKTYKIGFPRDCPSISIKTSDHKSSLWPSAMKCGK